MCSGSEAGSYLRLIDFVYHSTLGLSNKEEKKKKEQRCGPGAKQVGSAEGGSYLRLIDSCITQLKAQGPSRTCNESKEEEAEEAQRMWCGVQDRRLVHASLGVKVIKKKEDFLGWCLELDIVTDAVGVCRVWGVGVGRRV